jgi:hypothetical protein
VSLAADAKEASLIPLIELKLAVESCLDNAANFVLRTNWISKFTACIFVI